MVHHTLPLPSYDKALASSRLPRDVTLSCTDYYRRMTSSSLSSGGSLLSLVPPSPLSLWNVSANESDNQCVGYDIPRHTYRQDSNGILYQVPPAYSVPSKPVSPVAMYDSPRSPVSLFSRDNYTSRNRTMYSCPVSYRHQQEYQLLTVSPPVNQYSRLPSYSERRQTPSDVQTNNNTSTSTGAYI
jgi:hypothetical protein